MNVFYFVAIMFKKNFFFIFFVLLSGIGWNGTLKAQNYDVELDTLIQIGDFVINSDKVQIKRDQLFLQDSLKVNKTGLRIASFSISAITLGQKCELNSTSAVITPEMKKTIKGSKPVYKFIYLRNIILFDKFGGEIKPSLKEVRISFID